MDNNNEKVIDVLNDLVQINNDRIDGYQKAIDDSRSEGEYDDLFSRMIDQSIKYKEQLINEIDTLGGKADRNSNTGSGKVYHVWMDVKSSLQGKTDKSALQLSEFGEDAAQKAYKEALQTDNLPASTRELIINQKEHLKESHDTIKRKRDMQEAHSHS
jgi:uncharacterized protein (TIGR02284 family)